MKARAVIRGLAGVLVLGLAAIGVYATGLGGSTQCWNRQPPTAGNRLMWFLGDVDQGRDPSIGGGVDNPYGCAYEQLCSELRGQVSEESFRATRGNAVSIALSSDGGMLARSGSLDEQVPGVDEELPDVDTLDEAVVATWKDYEFSWVEHIDDHILIGSERTERWRVALVREGGTWRVCGFEKHEV